MYKRQGRARFFSFWIKHFRSQNRTGYRELRRLSGLCAHPVPTFVPLLLLIGRKLSTGYQLATYRARKEREQESLSRHFGLSAVISNVIGEFLGIDKTDC